MTTPLTTGFPRTVKQAIKLDDKFDIDIVINLDVPFTTITDRISVSPLLMYEASLQPS